MSIPIEYKVRLIGGPADGQEFLQLQESMTHEIIMRNTELDAVFLRTVKENDPVTLDCLKHKDYKYQYKDMTPDGWYLYEYIGRR